MATDLWKCKLPSSLDASLTETLLDQLSEELRHINSILEDAVSPLFTKLHYLQDRLWTLLPCESQECAKADLELQTIQLADREMISSTDISQN